MEREVTYAGLSEKEASKRLEKYGKNTLNEKKRTSALKIFINQFADFMTIILIAATAVSVFMNEVTEAVAIIAIVIVNAILGFIQEYRTERTLKALKELSAPTVRVVRDGKTKEIPAALIVPGDLIMLEAGDRVPADAALIAANNLQVDESLLTGESVPVEKKILANKKKGKGSHYDINRVYMGTIVTSGRARAVVDNTGMFTEMGQIAEMIQNVEEEQTPLQKKLDHLGKYIVYGCLIICMIVTLTGILRGEELFPMLLAGISLAVAAIPEGLTAVVTISLALGVQRMLRRNALIRKLPAVETLGSASIICSDKTGTLTENRMTVRKIYAGERYIEVTGHGDSVKGRFSCGGKEIDVKGHKQLRLALEIGALCNNAQITGVNEIEDKGFLSKVKKAVSGRDRVKIAGDPTEGALLVAAAKAGLTENVLCRRYSRIDEIPFDSNRKCMSVICEDIKGETFLFVKGAPDVIIKKCSEIQTLKGLTDITAELADKVMKANDDMASRALRILGVAYKKLGKREPGRESLEEGLVFAGLIGMIDPPRSEVKKAVLKCKMAGIKPVMITGDHKITACAIAKELDIYEEGDKVLTGEDLDKTSERKLEEIAHKVSVYARVSPKHKLMIVKVLKRLGHIVAMTGDGVNDAPAVKEADIGVSMGITGTDVTKEASSMILLDDNFATIVAAIEEGRVIYSNIRKFIRYLLSCNIGEVLTMFLGMLMGFPIPLLPIQILWVNLVTDGLPAIALGLEPAEKDIMIRRPRRENEGIFSDGLAWLILIRGMLLGISTLAVFASILYFTGNIPLARTSAFVTLVMTQLIHVFECKSERRNIFEINIFSNIYLVLAVMCSITMILSAVYLPMLQPVFKTVSLSWNEWALVLGFSSLGPVGTSFFRKRIK
jgi:Ca2+-transporting ATPase